MLSDSSKGHWREGVKAKHEVVSQSEKENEKIGRSFKGKQLKLLLKLEEEKLDDILAQVVPIDNY